VQERFRALGAEPAASSPEEFRTMIREELDKWRDVTRKANLRFD
jgi:tripartite-type tricarboxylate transporter receptor subunit TctC